MQLSPQSISKLIELAACDSVEQICKPLFTCYGFNVFVYVKMFKDGSTTILSNRGDWLNYFYQSQYVNPNVTNPTIKSGYYLNLNELDIPDNQIKIARENFNADNWLNIIQTNLGYDEVYGLATPRGYYQIINTYINNKDALEHFILYFKDKAHDLIKKADMNRIIPTEVSIVTPDQLIIKDENSNVKEKFYQETKINRYFLRGLPHNKYLTKREFEIASLLANGKQMKEVADLLGLTHRTVAYYLDNAKTRLNCFSRSQLIDIVTKSNAHDVFINIPQRKSNSE